MGGSSWDRELWELDVRIGTGPFNVVFPKHFAPQQWPDWLYRLALTAWHIQNYRTNPLADPLYHYSTMCQEKYARKVGKKAKSMGFDVTLTEMKVLPIRTVTL